MENAAWVELELYDPEEDKVYKIKVTMEEYDDVVINNNLELAKMLLERQQYKENFHVAYNIHNNINKENCGSNASTGNTKENRVHDPPKTAPNSNSDEENTKLWTNEAIKLLITLCKKYDKEFETGIKKYIWEKIARELTSHLNQSYSAQQCDTKFKGLKNTYKQVQKHNKQSGNDNKKWAYYSLMDEILFCKPEINPVATCSSSTGLVVHDPNLKLKGKTDTSENDEHYSTSEELSSPSSSSFSKKRKKTENAIERRHQEKMSRQDKYLQLLERLTRAVEHNNNENKN